MNLSESNKTVFALCSHPDDAEFMCTGTLALLHERGWQIQIATMTPGDCGSVKHTRQEISNIRRNEAAASAKLLGGTYHCLECDDVFIMYDKPTLLKVIEWVRKVRPTLVFAPSPQDYFIDHENTSKLVRTACFSCGIPNVETPSVQAYDFVPYLYYVDPCWTDIFGNEIQPSMYVDISSVIKIKEQMLCCHESQRSWLKAHHGMDEYVDSMKRHAQKRGKEINCQYAEGFRQHLGQSYPQDNILKKELSELVIEK
jgi:LmbE family N-acetylglucosaminyl deacetylase